MKYSDSFTFTIPSLRLCVSLFFCCIVTHFCILIGKVPKHPSYYMERGSTVTAVKLSLFVITQNDRIQIVAPVG